MLVVQPTQSKDSNQRNSLTHSLPNRLKTERMLHALRQLSIALNPSTLAEYTLLNKKQNDCMKCLDYIVTPVTWVRHFRLHFCLIMLVSMVSQNETGIAKCKRTSQLGVYPIFQPSKHYNSYHHHHTTTVLRPLFRDHPCELVPEENFWTLRCKGRLTEADTLTIRLGATPSGLTSAHLHHPP